MNSPLQHSGDENGSSSSTEGDQSSGSSMSVSESESELQHSGDENDQGSCISVLESESESKSESSQQSSNRATERGVTSSNFTLENFLFRAQLRPGDVEGDRLTLLQTVSDNFFGEAGTSRRQRLLLFCDCHKESWSMKFKDPPMDCGRLGVIGLKAFVAAHNLRPPDVICFHQPAQPLHLNHYFVHGVRTRPRTKFHGVKINDYDDDDDGGSEGGRDEEPNSSNGDGERGGDGGPNSSNSDKGKGVDSVTTRPGGGGSKRGESSGGKGKGVITGNEKPETCLFEKQLTERDVVGPSMEKPISRILQADLRKHFRCTNIF